MDGMINYYDEVKGKSCHELLAVLDEIGRTGLPNLPHYSTTVAGRKISLLVVVQNPAYFEANYGVYQARILRGQMEYQIVYRPADYDTAEEIQRWLHVKSGFAQSYSKWAEGEVSEGLTEREVPLMSADELMLLGDEETICFKSGMRRFRARRVDIRRFPVLKQRQAIPPPPLPVPSQDSNRALTTIWEERYPASFVDPD